MARTSFTYRRLVSVAMLLVGLVGAVLGMVALRYSGKWDSLSRISAPKPGSLGEQGAVSSRREVPEFKPRSYFDASGFPLIARSLSPWTPSASLEEIAASWESASTRTNAKIEGLLNGPRPLKPSEEVKIQLLRAQALNYEANPEGAYKALERARSLLGKDDADQLYTILYFQGICAMRRGENENCIMCLGESACILPISEAAVHTNPEGSQLAVKHFHEYLEKFPDDLEVRWLLNLAHMTLGEYPRKVDPAFLIPLDRWLNSEFNIGKFRNVADRAKVNFYNQAGGAVMEDFDNDGQLDLVITAMDPSQHMSYFRNRGDGTFEERTESAGVMNQLGGLYCVQTDYDNDGFMDLYIPRGAWLPYAMRPTLLRNDGGNGFKDVTAEAGLMDPVCSNSASWADYDNDGFLDLFVCCEQQACRLFHNLGNGRFEEVSLRAGLVLPRVNFCKGASWVDFDNDRYPDLFLSFLTMPARFFRNNRDGTFTDATAEMGIDGPRVGFSCWAWDYDNDGWLDIFATSYDRTLRDVIKGMIGEPHERFPNRLFHNLKGTRFQDVTKEAGLDMIFETMGSNFGDFDNDGFLDMYLATGEPNIATLIPNRMFKNVDGKRFAEITASSGTGHLQKGHAVACADWDRDGDLDIFVQTGGVTLGDKFHNILFENPGQGNNWINVKLAGKKTNRPAIGARIKVVTAGPAPQTLYRHVTSGSSFGGNPLEQMIGVGKADRIATLEISWPTSDTTQVFHDIAVNQAIEITEFATEYQKRPVYR